jgi:hypothetical protein
MGANQNATRMLLRNKRLMGFWGLTSENAVGFLMLLPIHINNDGFHAYMNF